MHEAGGQLELQRLAEAYAQAAAQASGWLSAIELARLARLRVPARREQYLAGHWLARVLLAERFGGRARAWQLQEREGLPPAVIDAPDACFISLSHSGAWLACAIASEAIGIDVEARPRLHSLASVEKLLLGTNEAPGSVDSDGLLLRWVAKEALIKQRCASALPERLQQLQLHPLDGAACDVRVYSAPNYHLAVAARCEPAMRGLSEHTESRAWRAHDLAVS